MKIVLAKVHVSKEDLRIENILCIRKSMNESCKEDPPSFISGVQGERRLNITQNNNYIESLESIFRFSNSKYVTLPLQEMKSFLKKHTPARTH